MRFAKSSSAILAITTFASLSTFTACIFTTDEKVAGGAQDFPNTLTLGAAVSSHVNDHAEWDQFSVIPNSLPTFAEAESLYTAPESLTVNPKRTAAGKASASSDMISASAGMAYASAAIASAAAADTVYTDYSDTAGLKVARLIRRSETAFRLKGDTLVYRWDAKATDSIIGNELLLESKGAETVKATERRKAYRYENTDSAGGFDRAWFLERLPAILPAGFKHRLLSLLPGPDGNFETKGDNRPAYYAFARTKSLTGGAVDTLEAFDITDADGDGALWGAGDSGVVDFRHKIPTPALRPTVELVVQRMRAVLFKEENKSYPISYRETRTEKDGKKIVFSVRGERGEADSTFQAGDTVWVTVHADFPEGARMVEKTIKYKVVLAGVPKKYADNKLLKFTLNATWNKGDSLASSHFVFTPDKPVLSNELSISGTLTFTAGLANEASAVAEGTFKDKVIDAEVTHTSKDGKLRRYHARWSHLGAVLQQNRLD